MARKAKPPGTETVPAPAIEGLRPPLAVLFRPTRPRVWKLVGIAASIAEAAKLTRRKLGPGLWWIREAAPEELAEGK